jgi:hypothetical protein
LGSCWFKKQDSTKVLFVNLCFSTILSGNCHQQALDKGAAQYGMKDGMQVPKTHNHVAVPIALVCRRMLDGGCT